MSNSIFRKKSLDQVSSPDQLNRYIRVANPGVWMLMCAVVLLLIGTIVWSVYGKLDTMLNVSAMTEGDRTVCYVRESELDSINRRMKVLIGNSVYSIDYISVQPVQVDESYPEYLLHVGELSAGEWVYPVILKSVHGEDGGIYHASIIIESIAPISFVAN